MNACLQALLAPDNTCATIDSAIPWTEPCAKSPWVGAVADGGMCFSAFECSGTGPGTSYCAPNQTCKALPPAGQPCAPQGCAAGNYCNNAVCTALKDIGGVCTTTNQCTKNLFCDFAGGATGHCAVVHKGGEACTSSAGCDSALCLPGTCSGSNTSCYTSSNCNGMCGTGPNAGQFCTVDQNCGGHCSITTTQNCYGSGDCPTTPTVETCVFATCTHQTCTGDIVCAAKQVTADYCTGPRSVLPI
jgi:hypothetical protein